MTGENTPFDDVFADPFSRFATVAMADTNQLLRDQMGSSLATKGLVQNGIGIAPAQLSLDPPDALLNLPRVNDDAGDFHDDLLKFDPPALPTSFAKFHHVQNPCPGVKGGSLHEIQD